MKISNGGWKCRSGVELGRGGEKKGVLKRRRREEGNEVVGKGREGGVGRGGLQRRGRGRGG